jgi:AraC-like DNA-binding protein
MEQTNRPDIPPVVEARERMADSLLATRIRHARYLGAAREVALPDGSWDLLFVRKSGGPWTVIQTGQIAAPVEVHSDAGDEMLTIALRPEVYMPRLPGRLTLNQGVLRPVEGDRRFWIEGERFEIPDFENAEQLVAALTRKGLLERDPVVALALRGARQRLDERSVQRHFADVTGLGLKAFQQIERAHEAAGLLRAGQTPSQVAAALGFTDQAHLTHSLKRILGQTPGRMAKAAG